MNRFPSLEDAKKSEEFKKLLKMFSVQRNRMKIYNYIEYKCRFKQSDGCEAKYRLKKVEGSRSVALEIPEDQDEPHSHSDVSSDGRKYKKYTPAKGK